MSERRSAIVFPKDQQYLRLLGENMLLALKRRRISQTLLAQRSGLSRPTLRKIFAGDPTVSMGHYMVVLSILGLAGDLALVAKDDEFGRKLRDIELLKKSARNANHDS
ncbi:helix-turn-helix domain-containing protein [Pseudidiomarina mangrovi]|uniref:helix-turn-helix domain-containing protein n=1 Tax=Pseudidiomarina mangrovi TaxID=2487133 RepID=UPI000FCA5D8B|nr:helix-turn-helix domain-containing protein [Pseudidiomarina mangrovi]